MYSRKIALATVALALTASPALALPSQVPDGASPPENSGTDRRPATPGPGATLPEKARAYGRSCKDQSKQRVDGEKGTPFSLCVTAMAKLANGRTNNPREACKAESKKHVKGEKGTPFSNCVKAGAKLLRNQEEEAETTA